MQTPGLKIMQSRSLMVVLAVLGVALALPADAQWKWRDKSGRVQYSDLPPPASVADQEILQRPNGGQRQAGAVARPAAVPASAATAASAASGVATLAPKTVEPELEAKRRKVEEEKAAKDKLEERIAAAKADNCTRAKSQLRTIDDGIRIARTNANGEREILDDKGRAEERKRTMDIMGSDCK